MRPYVDSLLIINNERLKVIYGVEGVSTAFKRADNVLLTAARGIAEIITVHGYINVDFEDVKTVMKESGVALMGSAVADGEDRAINAIKEALTSPLLNDNDIKGARDILLNMTFGNKELTMDEVDVITKYVEDAVGESSNIIWGTGPDQRLEDEINVTIIATGFEMQSGLYENTRTQKVIKDSGKGNKGTENPTGTAAKQGVLFPEPDSDVSPTENENKYSRFRNVDELHDDDQLDDLEGKPAYQRSSKPKND
jgi:cell division protein FtsZ